MAGAAALRIGLELLGAQSFGHAMREGAEYAQQIQRSIARANESIGAIAETIRVSGGTAGQGGALGGLARLTGDDPNGVAGAARSFREHLASSPMAQASLGRGALSAGTGQLVNEAELFLEAQRQVLQARSDEEARVKAQIYGLERLLPLRDADARLTEEMIRLGEENGRLIDDNLRKEKANLDAMGRIREETWQRLLINVERDLLPLRMAWERLLGGITSTMAAMEHPAINLPRLFADFVGGNWADIGRVIGEAWARHQQQSPTASPLQQNTAALGAVAEELKALNKDFLGGRERTMGAWPRNLGGRGLQRALEGAAFDLGAVQL